MIFLHYQGTKAGFIEKGYQTQYEREIVFISGADGKGECIYARGKYFADFSELIKNLSFLKGIKTVNSGETEEQNLSISGGGNLKLSVSENLKIIAKKLKGTDEVEEDIEVSLDISETLAERVNNLKARIKPGNGIKIEQDEEDTTSIVVSVDVIDDSLEESPKKTWSIDKIREAVNSIKVKTGIGTETKETTEGIEINILTDQSSIVIKDNKLTVEMIDGGEY